MNTSWTYVPIQGISPGLRHLMDEPWCLETNFDLCYGRVGSWCTKHKAVVVEMKNLNIGNDLLKPFFAGQQWLTQSNLESILCKEGEICKPTTTEAKSPTKLKISNAAPVWACWWCWSILGVKNFPKSRKSAGIHANQILEDSKNLKLFSEKKLFSLNWPGFDQETFLKNFPAPAQLVEATNWRYMSRPLLGFPKGFLVQTLKKLILIVQDVHPKIDELFIDQLKVTYKELIQLFPGRVVDVDILTGFVKGYTLVINPLYINALDQKIKQFPARLLKYLGILAKCEPSHQFCGLEGSEIKQMGTWWTRLPPSLRKKFSTLFPLMMYGKTGLNAWEKSTIGHYYFDSDEEMLSISNLFEKLTKNIFAKPGSWPVSRVKANNSSIPIIWEEQCPKVVQDRIMVSLNLQTNLFQSTRDLRTLGHYKSRKGGDWKTYSLKKRDFLNCFLKLTEQIQPCGDNCPMHSFSKKIFPLPQKLPMTIELGKDILQKLWTGVAPSSQTANGRAWELAQNMVSKPIPKNYLDNHFRTLKFRFLDGSWSCSTTMLTTKPLANWVKPVPDTEYEIISDQDCHEAESDGLPRTVLTQSTIPTLQDYVMQASSEKTIVVAGDGRCELWEDGASLNIFSDPIRVDRPVETIILNDRSTTHQILEQCGADQLNNSIYRLPNEFRGTYFRLRLGATTSSTYPNVAKPSRDISYLRHVKRGILEESNIRTLLSEILEKTIVVSDYYLLAPDGSKVTYATAPDGVVVDAMGNIKSVVEIKSCSHPKPKNNVLSRWKRQTWFHHMMLQMAGLVLEPPLLCVRVNGTQPDGTIERSDLVMYHLTDQDAPLLMIDQNKSIPDLLSEQLGISITYSNWNAVVPSEGQYAMGMLYVEGRKRVIPTHIVTTPKIVASIDPGGRKYSVYMMVSRQFRLGDDIGIFAKFTNLSSNRVEHSRKIAGGKQMLDIVRRAWVRKRSVSRWITDNIPKKCSYVFFGDGGRNQTGIKSSTAISGSDFLGCLERWGIRNECRVMMVDEYNSSSISPFTHHEVTKFSGVTHMKDRTIRVRTIHRLLQLDGESNFAVIHRDQLACLNILFIGQLSLKGRRHIAFDRKVARSKRDRV